MPLTTRASRYPLRMSIRFRPAGAPDWLHGETINISESGVLFEIQGEAPNGSPILEMALEMSTLGPRIANVSCTGRIVRSSRGGPSTTLLAATIERYQFAKTGS